MRGHAHPPAAAGRRSRRRLRWRRAAGGQIRESTTSAKAPAPQAPRFDPPVTFDPKGAKPISAGPEPVLWERFVLRTADTWNQPGANSLQALDLLTGEEAWKLAPKTTVRSSPTRPLVVSLGGRTVVLAAFGAEIPGVGTLPARRAVELIAADPGTGKLLWSSTLEVGNGKGWPDRGVRLVGADDAAIVIGLDLDPGQTLVVDPATRRVRWIGKPAPQGYTAGRVFATTGRVLPDRFETWDVKAQRKLWDVGFSTNDGTPNAYPGGPSVIVQERSGKVVLMNAADGKVRATQLGSNFSRGRACLYDDVSVLVCQVAGSDLPGTKNLLTAHDSTTLKRLWELPANGRNMPGMTAAWHGAVYGTTENGPVVLNARSGADREPNPGAAPTLISANGGLSRNSAEPGRRSLPSARPRFV